MGNAAPDLTPASRRRQSVPSPSLSEFTTLRLGGAAREFIEATTEDELIDAVRDVGSDELFVLGGGSNVVVADDGFGGTAVHVKTRRIEHLKALPEEARMRVASGENWDDLVRYCIAENLAGVEAMSYIPGTVGGTPIQNVGAYGQRVSETIEAVRVYNRTTGAVETLSNCDCGFAYRWSRLKQENRRYVVLSVDFRLRRSRRSAGLTRQDLCDRLCVPVAASVPLGDVRAAVLQLRSDKGMVLDPTDHDTWSVGSFFINPQIDAAGLAVLEHRVRERLGDSEKMPVSWEDGRAKPGAAWLIEKARFPRGYPREKNPQTGVSLSTKHALALTNRGHGTTRELVELARKVAARVEEWFGIPLKPEPAFVGHCWDPPACESQSGT